MFVYSIKRVQGSPVPLQITCPWCGRTGTGISYEQTDWLRLLHLVPLFRWRNVFVRCFTCKKELVARCSLAELQQFNPLTRQHYLVKRVSFVAQTCAILGLGLCWAPLVGIIPATIAFIMTRRSPGWAAKVSVVALALSALTTAVALAVLILDPHR